MKNIPVIVLLFNRPYETKKLFESLSKLKPQKLYINQDGPRKNFFKDLEMCNKVRDIALNPDWDCDVFSNINENNQGCRKSVSSGLNWFFEKEEFGIILEDDCIPSKSFFNFSKKLLDRYKLNKSISVISGSNFQKENKIIGSADYYYSKYAHCWGWSSWRRAWKLYDKNLSFWPDWKNSTQWKTFHQDKLEQKYWTKIFDKVYDNQIDSWAYIWQASVWYNEGITVTPNKNLILNIGFNKDATHTNIQDKNISNNPIKEINEDIKSPDHIQINNTADLLVFKNHFKGKFNFFPWKLLLYFKYFFSDPFGFAIRLFKFFKKFKI